MAANIGFFNIIEIIGSLIQDEIQDVNNNRVNKRWVFPEFPESNENYPEVIIKLGPVNYVSNSNENLLYCETIGSVFNEYYYRKANSQLQISVLTEKRTSYHVSKDGEELYLYGSKLNSYITNEIKELIIKKHSDGTLTDVFERFEITNIEFNFDSNKNTWASTILCDISFKDGIVKRYHSGNLIASYSINETITTI